MTAKVKLGKNAGGADVGGRGTGVWFGNVSTVPVACPSGGERGSCV